MENETEEGKTSCLSCGCCIGCGLVAWFGGIVVFGWSVRLLSWALGVS